MSGNTRETKGRLNAGVLPFVLAISLVLAVVCGAAVLLIYYHQITILNDQLKEKLRANVQSGFQYGLASLSDLPENEWLTIDLFGEGNDSVKIRKERWGLFNILDVEAFKGKHRFRKVALTGIHLMDAKPALYLPDNGLHSFAIAGDSRLSGDVHIPKAEIRDGHVEGEGYRLSKLVFNGKILTSKSTLPEPEKEILARLQELSGEAGGKGVQPFLPEHLYSFEEEAPLQINIQERVVLRDSLMGKVMLRSNREIVVEKGSYVKDVILLAPKITVKEGFEGQFQAFASDTIIVEREVKLQYPTVLAVLARADSSYLELQENSRIDGIVFHLCQEGSRAVNLKIEQSAEVLGEVWCNGLVTHFGKIAGTLSCSQFFFIAGLQNKYHNYLFNGKVEKTELPAFFVSSPLLNSGGRKDIVKWVY